MPKRKPERYWLASPWTWRTGPGHKYHLTRDTKKTKQRKALCQVERNAHRLVPPWGLAQREPWTLEEIPKQLRRQAQRDRLCKNCLTLAERREHG